MNDDIELILKKLELLQETIDNHSKEIERLKEINAPKESLILPLEKAQEKVPNQIENQMPINTTQRIVSKKVIPKPQDKEITSKETSSIEMKIGATWINRIGVVAIIFALGYFLKYTFDRDLIPPSGRIMIGISLGIFLLLLGERFSTKYLNFSLGLTGGGIAGLYFSIYSAFAFYSFISQTVAFCLLIVITATAATLSMRYNSAVIMLIGTLLGFLTPFMVSTGTPNDFVFLSYNIILNLGVLGIAIFRKWKFLNYITFFITEILFTYWIFERGIYYTEDFYLQRIQFALSQSASTIIFLIFIAVGIFYNHSREKNKTNKFDYVLLILTSAFYFWHSYYMFDAKYPNLLGLYAVSMSIFFITLGFFLFRKSAVSDIFYAFLLGISLTFLTIAIPLQLEDNAITLSWAVESALLMYLSFSFAYPKFRIGSYVIIFLTLSRMLIIEFEKFDQLYIDINKSFIPIFNLHSLVLLFSLVFIFFNVFLLYKNKNNLYNKLENASITFISVVANIFVIIILFINTSIYLDRIQQINDMTMFSSFSTDSIKQFTYSAILIIYSLGALVSGIKIKSRNIRIFALVLFMLSIVKVFLLDLSVLDGIFRIMSFVLLGIILLGVSFIYQKYNYLILGTEAKHEKIQS